MNKKIRIFLSYLLVIVWLIVIFHLSSMDNKESNTKSKKTITKVITVSQEIKEKAPEKNIKTEEIKKVNIEKITNKINPYIRKCAHALVYMILAILMMNAIRETDIRGWKSVIISIIFCFLYAMTDEYHQTFVNGRTGRPLDICIDTCGAMLGSFIYFLLEKIIVKLSKFIKIKEKINTRVEV